MYAGVSIIREGLSLAVDASSTKSYPGTGEKWYDLSTNRLVFSSKGTQTPLTTIAGAKCFDFNDSGYWESDEGHENVNLAGDCTLLFWFYAEDITERDTFFEKAGVGNASYQQELAVTLETTENFSYYSRKTPGYDVGRTYDMTLNKWNFMGIKISSGETTNSRVGYRSINGSNWSEYYSSNSNEAIIPAGPIKIGTGYAGPVENGYIGSLYCYNRMLNDNEVSLMYRGLKGRYGL